MRFFASECGMLDRRFPQTIENNDILDEHGDRSGLGWPCDESNIGCDGDMTQPGALRDAMRINRMSAIVVVAVALAGMQAASAQRCTRQGNDVTCDDGRRGILEGDSILWPDGTRSSSSPHPSVIIGNKSSVRIGPGVFVGKGSGMVPMDDPNAPNKTRCAIVDEVSYCH
jgi:hypothetical protein